MATAAAYANLFDDDDFDTEEDLDEQLQVTLHQICHGPALLKLCKEVKKIKRFPERIYYFSSLFLVLLSICMPLSQKP